MAHDLQATDHMVSGNNITPWHRLGTVVDGTLTVEEAYVESKLNWSVSKHPAFTRLTKITLQEALPQLLQANAENPNADLGDLLTTIGYDLPIEGKFATIREDLAMPLGVVGNDYTCFQNRSGFDLIEALLKGGDIGLETAGSLGDSRKAFALAKLDLDMTIMGDEHVPYLLFTWSHDGSSAIRVIPTPVRVVCANTLRMALSRATASWTASHTASVHGRAREAATTLQLGWKYYAEFETEVAKLIDLSVTNDKFEQVLAGMVPDADTDATDRKVNNVAEKRGAIRNIYAHDETVGAFQGTGWGVVQAFSNYDLWSGTVHGGEGKRADRQAARVLSGTTMANTSRVRELLLASN